MANIFEVTDCRGRRVVCSEEIWCDHILAGRSWMRGWEPIVIEAIEHPTYICEDRNRTEREVYYLLRTNGEARYIKVVVNFAAGENGSVVSAFPTDSGKAGERIIWI